MQTPRTHTCKAVKITHIPDSPPAKSLTSVHTHPHSTHTPISFSIYVCVSTEQRCTNLRGNQPIGMLRPGQHWMLHWNSALGITRPRTSSCFSATVGHAIITESFPAYSQYWLGCGWSLNRKSYCFKPQWQIQLNMQCETMLKCVQLQHVCCAQDGLRESGLNSVVVQACVWIYEGWWASGRNKTLDSFSHLFKCLNLIMFTWAWQANSWSRVSNDVESKQCDISLLNRRSSHLLPTANSGFL